MTVDVKWNLFEATEVSVITDSRIIDFESEGISIMNGRLWTDPEGTTYSEKSMQDLLDNYERAGCVVLVAAPRKEELALPKPHETFDWDEVYLVFIKHEGYTSVKFKYSHTDDDDGGRVFDRWVRFAKGEKLLEDISYYNTNDIKSTVRKHSELGDEVVMFNESGDHLFYK